MLGANLVAFIVIAAEFIRHRNQFNLDVSRDLYYLAVFEWVTILQVHN